MPRTTIRTAVIPILFLAAAAAAPPLAAQPPSSERSTARVEERLASIHQELRRLVALVEEQSAHQRLALALHRLALEERAVAELVAELGVLRQARRALLDARFDTQEGLERYVAEARREVPDPSAEEAPAIERRIRDLERRVQELDDELIATERRIDEIEETLPGRRAALGSLRARVDQRLGTF